MDEMVKSGLVRFKEKNLAKALDGKTNIAYS